MAQNDLKPNHSSSEEEEETSGSEDEQTSGAETDEISDTDSTSDADSDSDSPPKNSDPNVKAISSIPVEKEIRPNLDSKLAKNDGSMITIKIPRPLPAPTAYEKDAKKPKQNNASAEPNKKGLIAPSQSSGKPQAPEVSSSEGEESSSDTDSDSMPKKATVADSNIKPISSKPMERERPSLESNMASTQSPAKSKRPPPAPTANEKDAKKPKQNTANGEPKKALIASSQSSKKPQAPDLSLSGAEEASSSTDSDSCSPPKKSQKSTVADSNIKPTSSKPMEQKGPNVESKLVKKDGSKTISTLPSVKSKLSQPAAKASEKDAKKAKQNNANGEPKKGLIAPSQSAKKPQAPELCSSEGEESSSDTDSDSMPKKSTVSDSNIKPIKPTEREGPNLESKVANKDGSKTITALPSAKSKRAPPATTAKEKDVKKAKNTAADDDSKKQLFQRLWSEEDEIVILEGMIDYKSKVNGENPIADMGAFHEFIKKSLHVDVSRAQLVDKVRRLKKKYVNNVSREKDGKDRSFSKSHEQKGYELSKLIWGSNSPNSGTESKKNQSQKIGNSKGIAASTSTVTAANLPKSNGVDDKEKSMMEVGKNIDISRFFQDGARNDFPILPEEIVKAGMELVDGSRRAEIEEKWKKLKEQELKLYVRRMELLTEQALLVLEAINSSGN